MRHQGGFLAVTVIAVLFSLGCEDEQAGAPAVGGAGASAEPLEQRLERAGDKIMASDKKPASGSRTAITCC